jgi:hypothetical protein
MNAGTVTMAVFDDARLPQFVEMLEVNVEVT